MSNVSQEFVEHKGAGSSRGRVARRDPTGGPAALGNTTKFDDGAEKRRARRAKRYSLQGEAARLMPDHRVAGCMCRSGSGGVTVNLDASGNAFYGGVQVCGSVWACPVCSAKITESRRGELNALLAYAQREKLAVCLLTLTMRHDRDDALRLLVKDLTEAKRRLHYSRRWRSLRDVIVGQVTALELTHGQNGWHPHYHVLVLMRTGPGVAVDLVQSAAGAWSDALQAVGRSCNEHGYMVQDGSKAGTYVAKWGVAEELALSGAKESRQAGGYSPFALLAESLEGDSYASALWCEYVDVISGRKQLVWSRGLRDLVGLLHLDDVDLAEAVEGPVQELVTIEKPVWGFICKTDRRALVLTLAERGVLIEYLQGLRRYVLRHLTYGGGSSPDKMT